VTNPAQEHINFQQKMTKSLTILSRFVAKVLQNRIFNLGQGKLGFSFSAPNNLPPIETYIGRSVESPH
jgi:hypothetical protein